MKILFFIPIAKEDFKPHKTDFRSDLTSFYSTSVENCKQEMRSCSFSGTYVIQTIEVMVPDEIVKKVFTNAMFGISFLPEKESSVVTKLIAFEEYMI